jgi:hypothetical protein
MADNMEPMLPDDKDDKGSNTWPTVRDSWLEEVPGVPAKYNLEAAARAALTPDEAPVKSVPPPLPGSNPDPRHADLMFERLAASDYEGALLVAQSILAKAPGDQDALESAEIAASELWKLHVKRLGALDRIPNVALSADHLPPMLNARAAFMLARVDGKATIEELVARAGLPRIDALRALAELYLWGAITFST